MSYPRSALRAGAVAAPAAALSAVVCALLLAVAGSQWRTVSSPAPVEPADVLLGVLALLGAVLAAWVGIGVVLSALAALPGLVGRLARPVARRLAPAVVRRAVALFVGGAIVLTFTPVAADAGGVHATSVSASSRVVTGGDQVSPDLLPSGQTPTPTPAPTPSPSPDLRPQTPSPGLGPLGPSTPRSTSHATATRATAPAAAPTLAHTVAPGDTLWALAAAQLGPDATASQVVQQCRRWYAANREVIGADPDLILPGQHLVVPALGS